MQRSMSMRPAAKAKPTQYRLRRPGMSMGQMQWSMPMRPAAAVKPTQYRLHRLRMLLHPMQRSMPTRPAAKEKPTRHRLRRLRMSTRLMQRSMPTQATEQASRMPCRSRDPLKWYRRQAMFPKRMQVLARWCRRAATQQQAKPSAWRQTVERQPAISAIPRRRLHSSGQIVPSTVSKSIPLPARSPERLPTAVPQVLPRPP